MSAPSGPNGGKPVIMQCPNCNEADLTEFGSKWMCPECRYIEPCCTTDFPARSGSEPHD